jgi:hypothetical protein
MTSTIVGVSMEENDRNSAQLLTQARRGNFPTWIGFLSLGICGIGLICQPVEAAKKPRIVSEAEANGSFSTPDGLRMVKVLALGLGGPDNPGYGLQLEFQTKARKNQEPFVIGGYGSIAGDAARFTPEGAAYSDCTCDLLGRTVAGTYRKTGTTAKFLDISEPESASLFATFVNGVGTNTYTDRLYRGQTVTYKVDVKAGQVLSAGLDRPDAVHMSLFDPDGDLEPDAGGISELTSVMERAGVYSIVVSLNPEMKLATNPFDFAVTIGVKNQK